MIHLPRSPFSHWATARGSRLALLPFIFLCAVGSHGENIKIDIDAAWPARSDTTAAGFVQWALTGDLDTTKRSATHTFTTSSGPLTCTIRQAAPVGADPAVFLNANWLNKNGIAGGYKLSFDGVWVHQKNDAQSIDRPFLTGGALELTISGLSAGTHTITTYHNNIWGAQYGTMSRCRIAVGGSFITSVAPSVQVTNDNDCAAAFFTVTATAGQPVVITLGPDGSGAFDAVILNGFEIDRASAPGSIAVSPSPADGNEHVAANNDTPADGSEGHGSVTLSWTGASGVTGHDIYFGTSRDAVLAATRSSSLFRGTQTGSSLAANDLNSSATYYWRVDEITAAGNIVTGAVWSFRTRHLAFPGAEGYGRFARGGRGGRVIEVTNLLDYDTNEAVIPGSYRAAIEATGPRTIVFRVSGVIWLKRDCSISTANSWVTIAGQTAPGEGICLANYSAGLYSTHDVIMRFMRDRVGEASQTAMDGIGMGVGTDHSIVDHCTISWTIDEGTSSRDGQNITFQRNMISEALQHSYHYAAADRTKYETHAFAGSISGNIGSYHHNLLAHCTDRNWSLAGGLTQDGKYAGRLDIRNNVVYNWLGRTTDGGVRQLNYVNNYYRPHANNPFAKWLLRLDVLNPDWGPENYYMTGNVLEGYVDETHNWNAFAYSGESDPAKVAAVATQVRLDQELYPSYVTTHTAKEALKLVLSDVGANQPQADAIDRRIVQEVRDGTWHYKGTRSANYPNGIVQPPTPNYPGIIDTPVDVHDADGSPNAPWPMYATYHVPVDTDHDGMPDTWERAIGSDPAVANHNDDPNGDGYTLLEDYLNWLAGPHLFATNDRSIDVDLRPLAGGFTSPRFTVSSPVLGTIELQPDGRLVRFTPTTGAKGRGGFTYTITDTDGVSTSGTYGICVTDQAPTYEAAAPTQLTNISVRAVTRSRDVPLIIGFYVANGTKRLLLRAIGPSLAPFHVTDAIPDPMFELHASVDGVDRLVTTNDNWGDGNQTANLRQVFISMGAFALTDGSKDSALVGSVTGQNSGLVYDATGRSGVALTELYDAEPDSNARLVNASVLNFAGTGDNVLIVGLNVSGTGPKRLLVRAIGPGLVAFGRPNALADPKLEVFNTDQMSIAANDDWGNADVTQLKAAFRAAGAFDLSDTTSKDAALILTVTPASYSAVISGTAGQTGDALLEVYELP